MTNQRLLLKSLVFIGIVVAAVAGVVWWGAVPAGSASSRQAAAEMPVGVYYSPAHEWAELYSKRLADETGWIHLPELHGEPEFRSHVDPSQRGFLEPQVCGECHPDQYQGLLETAHYRTSELATRDTVLGEFADGENRLETKDPRVRFEMVAEGDRLFQTALIEQGGRQYEHRRPFDIVIGSGNHGQTYLYWEGDQLYQLPVSYFIETGWINSPGQYRDGTADFARGVGERCLDCHSTFFATDPRYLNRHDPSNFILGVTCVRCHGPGWAHVQYHRHHPEDDQPKYIVNPGDLAPVRANEVCAQCHSGVGVPVQPLFSYRPGEPLDQFIELDMNTDDPKNDDPHAANQLLRLMKSRCFNESGNMTCITCHDPHANERGQLQVFAERCAKCHKNDACHLFDSLGSRIDGRCIECHMPSRRDSEGAMQTSRGVMLPLLRDHLIRGWPDATQQVLTEMGVDPATLPELGDTEAARGGD